jgi:hypothetical protein
MQTSRVLCPCLVTHVFINIITLDVGLLPLRERDLNQDKHLCSIVHEITSELEMHDLVDPIICRCRKHQQLACQKGRFVACFPLNVLIVHSLELTITVDDEHLTCGGFSLGKTVRFGSLEFITDCFNSLSLSPRENNSGVVFVGTAHSRSPSMHTILEESIDEFYTAYSREGSFCFPV